MSCTGPRSAVSHWTAYAFCKIDESAGSGIKIARWGRRCIRMFLRVALLVLTLVAFQSSTPATNAIARLQEKIDSGSVKLQFDEKNGYLPSLLKELKIPVESQVLVFSK